jgi:hypothetical protein
MNCNHHGRQLTLEIEAREDGAEQKPAGGGTMNQQEDIQKQKLHQILTASIIARQRRRKPRLSIRPDRSFQFPPVGAIETPPAAR